MDLAAWAMGRDLDYAQGRSVARDRLFERGRSPDVKPAPSESAEPLGPAEPTPEEKRQAAEAEEHRRRGIAERERAEKARRAEHAEWGVRGFSEDTEVGRSGDKPVTAREAMDTWLGGPPGGDRAVENRAYVRERLAAGDQALEPVRDDWYGARVTEIYRRCHEGGGHYLERHDDGRGLEGVTQRADRLWDPAHRTDTTAYQRADDAEHPRQHRSGLYTTHIPDPVAFATAVARIHEHPRVKEALATPSTGRKPGRIADLSIEEILGPDGHQACRGWKVPGNDNQAMHAEWENRRDWVSEVRKKLNAGAPDWETANEQVKEEGRKGEHTMHEPVNERIPTFQGGTFTVAFSAREDGFGWEIKTLYPNPPKAPDKPTGTGGRP